MTGPTAATVLTLPTGVGAALLAAALLGSGTPLAKAVLGLDEPVIPALLLASGLMALGVSLHLSERHEHPHAHEAMEHEHEHEHDLHHDHHAPDDAYARSLPRRAPPAFALNPLGVPRAQPACANGPGAYLCA